MKMVDYEIKEIIPRVYAVKVEDGYQRAMLFLRSQEHYESAFPEIKGHHFDIFSFMEIYRKWKGLEYFSYPDDWTGFNVPSHVVESCTNYVLDARNGLFPTPYDYIMSDIINSVKGGLKKEKKYYLIGVDKFDGRTMQHELAHGLYYVNDSYKKSADVLVSNMPSRIVEELSNIILEMGYCEEVIVDEIQAYMSTGLIPVMSKIRGIKKETKSFSDHFKKYQ